MQNEDIHEYLKTGQSVTALDALELFNCFRLASRIHDLKKQGVDIKSEWLQTESGKQIKSYFMEV